MGLTAIIGLVGIICIVSDHLIVAITKPRWRRQFAPQIHPLSGLFVNLFLADLNANIADQRMADVVRPQVRWPAVGLRDWREIYLQEELTQELGLAGNQTAQALAELESTVQFNWNGLNRKGRVAPVDLTEECCLRLAGEIHILPAARDELQRCGCRHCSLRRAAVCGCA